MYRLAVTFTALDGKREEFVARLKSEGILDAIRNEEGCIKYDLYYADADPNVLLLMEEWRSKEDQALHRTLEHMARFRVLKASLIADTHFAEL